MLELQTGSVTIDSVDISRVRRDTIRRRCFVTVSQDALTLSNETMRFNLDPAAQVPDEIIIQALQKTQLLEHFTRASHASSVSSTYHDHPLLDQPLSSFPELSVGQCQLFALSRALVMVHSLRAEGVQPVVLLDEVTASLDLAAERRMHDVIDAEFTRHGHTVVAIAHRLGVLAEHARPGQDVVVQLRDGRVEGVGGDVEAVLGRHTGDNAVGGVI